jgi:hypothetical protein
MSIERGLCGFENGTLAEFGNYANTTLSNIIGTGARSGTYLLRKSSNAFSFETSMFPAGAVIGTTGTVAAGSHKRAKVRGYFRLNSSGWSPGLAGQQRMFGFGGDTGSCTVVCGRENDAGGFGQVGRRIGLRIGSQSPQSGVAGAYPWGTMDLTFDLWYRLILEVDILVSAGGSTINATLQITEDSSTPAINFTLTNTFTLGANVDTLDQLGIGPGNAPGANVLLGVYDWDDIVYIGTSNVDAASSPVLPVETKIIPALVINNVSNVNQWESGTVNNVTEVPVDITGGFGATTLSSVRTNGTEVDLSFQNTDTLQIGDIVGMKVFVAAGITGAGTGLHDAVYNGITKSMTLGTTCGVSAQCIGYQDWGNPLLTEAAYNTFTFNFIKRNGTQQSIISGISAEILWRGVPGTPIVPGPGSISPSSGPTVGGTVVTITGQNFLSTTPVYFDGIAAVITSVIHTRLTCLSPAHAAGPVDVQVGVNGANATVVNGFTYVGATPTQFTLLTARRDPHVQIQNQLGSGPSTFGFTVNGPDAGGFQAGSAVDIQFGASRLARGVVLTTERTVEDSRFNERVDARGSDNSWVLNSRLVVGAWGPVSATRVVSDILLKFAPEFSSAGVQAALPNISVAFYREVTVGGALDIIAKQIPNGHWHLDDNNTVFFISGTEATLNPAVVDDNNTDLLLEPAIKIKTDISQLRNRVFVRGTGSATSTGYQAPVMLPSGDPGGADPLIDATKALFKTGGNIDSNRNKANYNWTAAYIFVWTTTNGDGLGQYTTRTPTPYAPPGGYTTGSNALQCVQNSDDRVTGLKIYRMLQPDGPHGTNGFTFGFADLYTPNREAGIGPFFLITTIARATWPAGGGPITFLDTVGEDALVAGTMKKYSELVGIDNSANIFAMKEDKTSQTNLAALLGFGDGVREFLINDPNISTLAAAQARAQAELDLFANAIITVTYCTRDPLTKPGKTVTFNLSNPALVGTFKIHTVDFQHVHDNDTLNPALVVTASSVRFTLDDLFQRILLSGGGQSGGSSLASTAPANPPATGYAARADRLATPRNINSVAFDGTANINITAAPDHLTETPTGAVNSVNLIFTTSAIYKAGSLSVYVNGLRQKKTAFWTETTSTTFTMNQAPITGDLVTVDYETA